MKILVTGGASGLGEAIVRKLAQSKEHELLITYCNSRESAERLEKEFLGLKAFRVDFSSAFELGKFLDQMDGSDPEVLINNATIGFDQRHFHKMEDVLFENSFQSNVVPVIRITKKFIALARKRKSGKIITILTSYLINRPPIGLSEYVANKAYLQSMAKSWAIENASFGITSNSISPSFMKNNFTRATDDRVVESMIDENPNKTLLSEEEVAETVLFLVNSSKQINGCNLIMNAAKDLL